MKKIIFVLLIISHNIYAFDNFDIKWNLGNLGIGGNYFQDESNFEGFADLLNIGLEHTNTRIGFEFSPVKYWSWVTTENNINHSESSYSFLNLNIYWNILDFIFNNDTLRLYLGPFNSFNYMHLADKVLRWDDFIYTAGFRIGLGANISKNVYYNILGAEIGYRNFNGKNTFYVSAKVDILVFLIFALSPSYHNNNNK
jgi:hypothetical protein